MKTVGTPGHREMAPRSDISQLFLLPNFEIQALPGPTDDDQTDMIISIEVLEHIT